MVKGINLLNPDQSYIGYDLHKFPDGQQGITLKHPEHLGIDDSFVITSRLNNFLDLEVIICAVKAIRNATDDEANISLYVPYFLGARSDRKFTPGSYHYLKEVIGPIINSLGFKAVCVRDPHSDVLESVINNLEHISNKDFIGWALTEMGYYEDKENFIFISPDAGAYKKVGAMAYDLKHPGAVLTARKHRDVKTGNITHSSVPGVENTNGTYVLFDDICDGGRTFVGIADAILEVHPKATIILVVTHGIFSAGYAQLARFKNIYVTNSYKEFGADTSFIKSFNTFK